MEIKKNSTNTQTNIDQTNSLTFRKCSLPQKRQQERLNEIVTNITETINDIRPDAQVNYIEEKLRELGTTDKEYVLKKLDEEGINLSSIYEKILKAWDKVVEINDNIDNEPNNSSYIKYFINKIEGLSSPEKEYVIDKLYNKGTNPLKINFRSPINKKLSTIKKEMIDRIIKDISENPENFEKKLTHFLRLALNHSNDTEIKEIIEEIKNKILTLDKDTIIYYNQSYRSPYTYPNNGIIIMTNLLLDENEIVETIGHELGHNLLLNKIVKNNNKDRQFEELLCDTFGAYALSLFDDKKEGVKPNNTIDTNYFFQSNKYLYDHPNGIMRENIKNYILKNVNLESTKKNIKKIINIKEEDYLSTEEKQLLDKIKEGSYEEAATRIKNNKNLKIISHDNNWMDVLKFINKYNEYKLSVEGLYNYEEKMSVIFNELLNKDFNALIKDKVLSKNLYRNLHLSGKLMMITDKNRDTIKKMLKGIIEDEPNIIERIDKLNNSPEEFDKKRQALKAIWNKFEPIFNISLNEILKDAVKNDDEVSLKCLYIIFQGNSDLFNNVGQNYIIVTNENVKDCCSLIEKIKKLDEKIQDYDLFDHLFIDDENILQNYINSHNLQSSKS